MPTDANLTWNEIRDFTAGLWTREDQLMPPNGAQIMTDCYPVAAGGLRAWFKPVAFPTTGIDSVTDEIPKALFIHERLTNRSGNGTGNDYYLVTFAQAATTTKIYRMDQTAAGPPVTWTKIKTTAAGLEPTAPVHTSSYVTSPAGDRYFCFALGAAASADNGLWLVKYSDGTLTHLDNAQNGLVANYQNRLITAAQQSGTIKFTDAGLTTGIGTNTAPVDLGEEIEWITAFCTFSPGDLLVFKAGAPIYLVEGDLTNYTVRQMNGSHPRGNYPVRGPQGVIFVATEDGVYTTPDGSQIFPQSAALSSKTSDLGPPLSQVTHWLFTGRQGLVCDLDTGAWFKTSFITNAGGKACPIGRMAQNPGWLVADPGTGGAFSIWNYTALDGATDARAESYTWKSAPLREPSGRQLEIRAIQVVHKSTNGATSTIAVTVNGVTQTIACDSSGRGANTYYFRQRRESLDVQVVAASNASGVEAPRIEAVRIGTQPGHFLRQVADVG